MKLLDLISSLSAYVLTYIVVGFFFLWVLIRCISIFLALYEKTVNQNKPTEKKNTGGIK